MSAETPALTLQQVLRLLYNLPATEEEAARLAAAPLLAAGQLPVKQQFGPDRFDPLPRPRPPAPAHPQPPAPAAPPVPKIA